MKSKFSIFCVAASIIAVSFTACKKDDTKPLILPSSGSDTSFNLIAASESGANASNSAFIDFSADNITISGRASWDLAFYCGSDFRVTLNYKTAALTAGLTKNDLTTVAAADTIGLPLVLTYSADDFAKVDSFSGNLAYTRIPVQATASDNKVFIIQRGTGAGVAARPWYKVRVLRNASGGYTLQYARITETTYQTIDIAKDADYNFKFVSFDNGVVSAEPKKAEWDIQYSAALYKYPYGATDIPYIFSDIVLINYLGGVQAAEVLTTSYTFDGITLANAQALTYSSDRWAISDKWRTATSGSSPGVLTDRFYVVKDAAGNYYKLKFISFHNAEGGVRGRPEIKYQLIN
ncbi:MAG: hypothetical protein KF781_02045 [Chitinophagaceae bacterium]|nr:hypothetical protein [Chitinophagaceae bacterium]MCW5904290.1 hypothetical protein [Chitinophagaceae bacterium]